MRLHRYLCRITVSLLLLCSLAPTSYADYADLFDRGADGLSLSYLDLHPAVETSDSVAVPVAPTGVALVRSVKPSNTQLPADRVALWRGHLRE